MRPSGWQAWALFIVAAIIVLAVLEATNTTHLLHKQKATSGVIPSSSNQPSGSSSQNSAGGSSKTAPNTDTAGSPSSKDTNPTKTSNGPLVAPFGSFVSNHRPSLSGTGGVPSEEQSVCNTTPGAQCYITFTSGGVVKTLEAKTADSQGAVYWSWDVKTAGFTEGSWTINATASLNGQTNSTKDSLSLVVSQ